MGRTVWGFFFAVTDVGAISVGDKAAEEPVSFPARNVFVEFSDSPLLHTPGDGLQPTSDGLPPSGLALARPTKSTRAAVGRRR